MSDETNSSMKNCGSYCDDTLPPPPNSRGGGDILSDWTIVLRREEDRRVDRSTYGAMQTVATPEPTRAATPTTAA